ncbi:hypothetical protein ACQPZA_32445 [Pseudonocardia xinjiangensis]|uniref:hypothetical protein n=1 Tax=Pseudonocardia xinjiangensis TaxID=75289 RepID=UPI003D8EDC56
MAGHPAPDDHVFGPNRLDMAYPGVRLVVEYDGGEHRAPDRALRDLDRQAWLSTAG